MFLVINHIRVEPDHRTGFEERFRDNLAHMDGVEGFIRVRVWRPAEANKPDDAYPHDAYMVETEWTSEDAFRAWVGSPSFRASHAKPMPEEWKAGPAMMSRHALAFGREGAG